MSSSKSLTAIENLVIENSRLHKELQVIKTGDNVDAYTPHRDADYALDTLRQLGFGHEKPNATLAELVKEMASNVLNLKKHFIETDKYLKGYAAREQAILNISAGQDFDEGLRGTLSVREVSKLRGTLEMVKIRLERLEKFNYNEEINQLHMDLDKFLTGAVE